jgi:hypothetical protein
MVVATFCSVRTELLMAASETRRRTHTKKKIYCMSIVKNAFTLSKTRSRKPPAAVCSSVLAGRNFFAHVCMACMVEHTGHQLLCFVCSVLRHSSFPCVENRWIDTTAPGKLCSPVHRTWSVSRPPRETANGGIPCRARRTSMARGLHAALRGPSTNPPPFT